MKRLSVASLSSLICEKSTYQLLHSIAASAIVLILKHHTWLDRLEKDKPLSLLVYESTLHLHASKHQTLNSLSVS
jgi:hypothetical protein